MLMMNQGEKKGILMFWYIETLTGGSAEDENGEDSNGSFQQNLANL